MKSKGMTEFILWQLLFVCTVRFKRN